MPTRRHLAVRNLLGGVLVAALTGLITEVACSQEYEIPWHAVTGGGGESAQDAYRLAGVVGQFEAGSSSRSPYSIEGGFWAATLASSSGPAQPRLFIDPGAAAVVVSWPVAAGEFVLETAPSLSPKPAWSVAPQTPSIIAGNNTVTIPITGKSQFYRLRRQTGAGDAE